MSKSLVGLLLISITLSGGCASVRTLDAAQTGAPVIYSGTRLDWYSLQGGCYPVERFGAQAPKYAALDLPFSALLDTLLLPWALAVELGIGLTVQGGR
ncbi:YceK/YidQ family lipoprotein [Denitrificimonas caeni]|uniref:YceK/YidQ family lipoprotein n=1 Tax=Denitrificimonas caeni TaxID=521720 RepID=UPI003B28298A